MSMIENGEPAEDELFIVKESWHKDASGEVIMRREINGWPTDMVTAHPIVPVVQMPPCQYAPGGDVATIVFNSEK